MRRLGYDSDPLAHQRFGGNRPQRIGLQRHEARRRMIVGVCKVDFPKRGFADPQGCDHRIGLALL